MTQATAPCPRCGSTRAAAIGRNYWECDGVTSQFAPAGPGGQMVPVPVRCGHRFLSPTPGDATEVCSCGLYSIGRCSDCSGPFCGDHMHTIDGRRVCSACVELRRRDELVAAEQRVAEMANTLSRSTSARELETAILEAGDRVHLSTSEALRVWQILSRSGGRVPRFDLIKLGGGNTTSTAREVAPAVAAFCWRAGAGLHGITTAGEFFAAESADRVADPPFAGLFVTGRREGVRSRFGSNGRKIAAVRVKTASDLTVSHLREFLEAEDFGPERVFSDRTVDGEVARLSSLAHSKAKDARGRALAIGIVGMIILGLPLWVLAGDSWLVLVPWAWLISWLVLPRVVPYASQETRQLKQLRRDPSLWPAEPPMRG